LVMRLATARSSRQSRSWVWTSWLETAWRKLRRASAMWACCRERRRIALAWLQERGWARQAARDRRRSRRVSSCTRTTPMVGRVTQRGWPSPTRIEKVSPLPCLLRSRKLSRQRPLRLRLGKPESERPPRQRYPSDLTDLAWQRLRHLLVRPHQRAGGHAPEGAGEYVETSLYISRTGGTCPGAAPRLRRLLVGDPQALPTLDQRRYLRPCPRRAAPPRSAVPTATTRSSRPG
jgi:hypothetical protein